MICCSECTTPGECVREAWCFRRPPVPVEQDVDSFTRFTADVPTGEPRGIWVNSYLAPEQVQVLGPMTRRRAAEIEQQAQDDANAEAFSGCFPIPQFQRLDPPGSKAGAAPAPAEPPSTWSVRRCLIVLALFWVTVAVVLWAVSR